MGSQQEVLHQLGSILLPEDPLLTRCFYPSCRFPCVLVGRQKNFTVHLRSQQYFRGVMEMSSKTQKCHFFLAWVGFAFPISRVLHNVRVPI